MNWIFSKGSGTIQPLNSLQKQRHRQIESLKAAHSTIAEIQKDVEYRIPFTVNNSTISVNILLPPQFPQEKPVVTVYPPVRHHVVDGNNGTVVTSPLITNFGMHSDLGKVIQSLLDEFWKSPPVLMSGTPSFPFMYKPPYPAQNFHFVPAFPSQDPQRPVVPAPLPPPPGPEIQQGQNQQNRPPAPTYGLITDLPLPVPMADSQTGLNGHIYKMPEIPDSFPELSEMSVSQLKDMNDNEDVLLDYFACLPQLKQVSSDKEDLVIAIVTVAKKNLQLEPQLEGKRQEMLYKVSALRRSLRRRPRTFWKERPRSTTFSPASWRRGRFATAEERKKKSSSRPSPRTGTSPPRTRLTTGFGTKAGRSASRQTRSNADPKSYRYRLEEQSAS
ncbi:hypothetical protein PDJAM_G00174740 [Pangasius djambal]|uniref:Uncharacterized protein n=1 Tax=Pangasius djambal TaxID=1691987 RepID=A0ACC5ZN42_9TELE|nr:hypothetical protein [Pangasius djambal]